MTQTLPLETVLGQGDWLHEAVSILLNAAGLGLVGPAGTLVGERGAKRRLMNESKVWLGLTMSWGEATEGTSTVFCSWLLTGAILNSTPGICLIS